jgi:phosphoribosyl-ATP pyrophosphohydrolase
MAGIDLDCVKQYLASAGDARLTIAGGVATARDIAALDQLGVDAQVGMALYTNRLTLAECFCAPLHSDRPDGLWPTIVSNASGRALGLTYSNLESVQRSLDTGTAHYFSRKRGLWKKGETSGATQQLLTIVPDCDRDALMFVVNQTGAGFCHLSQPTCFGDFRGLQRLETTLADRMKAPPASSFTHRLFQSPELLASKITEEAEELNEAVAREEVIHEAADVIFFTMARLAREQIQFSEIEDELDRRSGKVTRRNTV